MVDIDLPVSPSRQHGLALLARFVPRAGEDYAQLRNFDLGPESVASRLSPFLRHRILTEPEVIANVSRKHGTQAYEFVSQMLWRTYWKGWLEMRPSIWRDYRSGVLGAKKRLTTEFGLDRTWELACTGKTGIDGFDAWTRELVDTGHLHNHARLWFASIWIFTLRLPWELGADFFLRHLLDGDPATNTLSWRSVAGLHTPGHSFLASAANIARFTEGRFRPADLAHTAHAVSGSIGPAAGPCPQGGIWDRGVPTALLLHEDDLSPEWLLDAGLRPSSTAFLMTPETRSPMGVSPRIGAFLSSAMRDCAARLSGRIGGIYGPVNGPRAQDALVAWARQSEARQIVTPFAPIGPLSEQLDLLAKRLAAENILLIRAMRPFDAEYWPHATHGYFRFRDAIIGRAMAQPPEGKS